MTEKKRKIRKGKKKKPSKKSVKSPVESKFWFNLNTWKVILPIMVLAFFVFSPNLNNEFVNWDDDINFFDNPHVVDANIENLFTQFKKIFKSKIVGNYNPLPIATFAVENVIFGLDNPTAWHVTNILLHLLCTLFLFRFLSLLKIDPVAKIIITVLFAIHPMRVESVAWITERKDVLFGTFYMIALCNYVKYQYHKKTKHLILVYLFFILSLFSKIQAVTLPLSMLAVDYWINRKTSAKLIFEKIGFFALSLVFGVYGVVSLEEKGSLGSNADLSFFQRLFIGSYSYLVYLIKSIIPYRLSPLYPYPSTLPWFIYASMVFVPSYLYLFYKAWKNNWKVIVFGLAFFTFNIVFLLQILGAGQGFLADRFTYIAYIGLFFIYGHGLVFLIQKFPKYKNVIYGACILLFGAYAILNYQQNKIWKNSDTLWSHVLKYYQNISVAWQNRANYYRDTGLSQKALEGYSKVIDLEPNKPEAYNSRGKLFFNKNTPNDLNNALINYNKAIELDPKNEEYLSNRGATFALMGNMQNAMRDLTQSISINPNYAVSYLNRSIIYQRLQNYESALFDINKYNSLNSYNPDMWYEAGKLERVLNNTNKAIQNLNKAIQISQASGLNPKGIYYYERSRTYYMMNQMNLARADLQTAQRLGAHIDAEYLSIFN